MRSLAEIHAEIVEHPELDEPRLEYARACAESAPDYAAYIRRSLRPHEFGYYSVATPPEIFERYAGPLLAAGANGCDFHRGFVETVYIDPWVFLERGDEILRLGPIMSVHLRTHEPARRPRSFPIMELASSPHLNGVRRLVLTTERFDLNSLDVLVESPNLDRLISVATPSLFGVRTNPLSEVQLQELWRTVYASAAFRRICNFGLSVRMRGLIPYGDDPLYGFGLPNPFADSFSYEEDADRRFWNVTYSPMPREGRELELQYGYMPSLHVANWEASPLEAMRGKLPAFPVGSRPTLAA